jgi:hypothetical protein
VSTKVKIDVPDLETGKQMVEEVQKEMSETFQKMQGKHGQEWKDLCDKHYELRNKKRAIQDAMQAIVKANRAARAN